MLTESRWQNCVWPKSTRDWLLLVLGPDFNWASVMTSPEPIIFLITLQRSPLSYWRYRGAAARRRQDALILPSFAQTQHCSLACPIPWSHPLSLSGCSSGPFFSHLIICPQALPEIFILTPLDTSEPPYYCQTFWACRIQQLVPRSCEVTHFPCLALTTWHWATEVFFWKC